MNSLKLYIFSNKYNLTNSNLKIYDSSNKEVYSINIKTNKIYINDIKRDIYKITISNCNITCYYIVLINRKENNYILNINEYRKNIFLLSDLNYQGLKIEKGFIFLNG